MIAERERDVTREMHPSSSVLISENVSISRLLRADSAALVGPPQPDKSFYFENDSAMQEIYRNLQRAKI